MLDGDWVGPEEREAAGLLEAYLRSRPIQESALTYGFRPADPAIPVTAPVDRAHGADPGQPQTLLEVPDAPTLGAVLDLWGRTKKTSEVWLVFDRSSSMRGEPLALAKKGADAFLRQLGDRDRVSLELFDTDVMPPPDPVALGGGGRERLTATLDGAIASGGHVAVRRGRGRVRRRAGGRRARPGVHRGRRRADRRQGREQPARADRAPRPAPVRGRRAGQGVHDRVRERGRSDRAPAHPEAGRGAAVRGTTDDIGAVFLDLAAFF